jgi:hypothetical protein
MALLDPRTGEFKTGHDGWLAYFCFHGVYDKAIEHLQKLERNQASKELNYCKSGWQFYPIHIAVMRRAPLRLVELMVDRASTPILELRDISKGCTPLACAALRTTDVEVVKFLVKKVSAASEASAAREKRSQKRSPRAT